MLARRRFVPSPNDRLTEIDGLDAQRRILLRIVVATVLATLAAAIVALAAALDAPAAAAARDDAAAADIVFTRHVRGTARADVYAVDPDGSGLRRLTRDGTSGDAAYSPDGARIVFASGRARGAHAPELYVMDADGRNARRLTVSEHRPRAFWRNTQPAWTPDGRAIVFVRTHVRGAAESTDLWRVAADGRTRPVRITTHPGREANPTFAPDGSLGFDRDGWIRLTPPLRGPMNVRPGTDPVWAPDRTYLAFVGAEGIQLTLGQSARTVAAAATAPAWSPDAAQLVYSLPDGGLGAVVLTGLERRRLTPASTRTEDLAPSWRPEPATLAQRSVASPQKR